MPGTQTYATADGRHLLAGLRDVMAGSGDAAAKLAKIMQLIADGLAAEVASCYVRRPGDILELYATVGLHQSAVHLTQLRVGEGIVGKVAASGQSLAVSDAARHPNFAYRPETGEDAYKAMLAVPILRDGQVRGVLALQNLERQRYRNAEVELLETIAMLVAELVAMSGMAPPSESTDILPAELLPRRLQCSVLVAGVASGPAVIHGKRAVMRDLVTDDPDLELDRLQAALDAMMDSIDRLVDRTRNVGDDSEPLDIIETYRMFAADRGWMRLIREAIETGLTAEAAIERVRNELTFKLEHAPTPKLRAQIIEIEDLTDRLLDHLDTGRGHQPDTISPASLPSGAILIADRLGAAELLRYPRERLAGLVLEDCGSNSHTAIVARALGLPALSAKKGILSLVQPLDQVILDGHRGFALIRPGESVIEEFNAAVQSEKREQDIYREVAELPSVTADGIRIDLSINAGLQLELGQIERLGADGVGLYRTEVPFMVRHKFPSVETQRMIYGEVLDAACGKPVVFRTLDIGSDKVLPYFSQRPEPNPALGWRAVRVGLDQPGMLRQQIRALMMASAGRTLRLLFPFVATVHELRDLKTLVRSEIDRRAHKGDFNPSHLRIGVMLEVPGLLAQLEELCAEVDFISVGSNDLLQYLFAADRMSPQLADRYDALNPIFLRVLRTIVRTCEQAVTPVSICGDMAGRPLEALALLGLGYRSLSVSPVVFGPLKMMIRAAHAGMLASFADVFLRSQAPSVRPLLRAYARDHGIPLGAEH